MNEIANESIKNVNLTGTCSVHILAHNSTSRDRKDKPFPAVCNYIISDAETVRGSKFEIKFTREKTFANRMTSTI